jgi:transposase
MARPAGKLWSPHHLLKPVRSWRQAGVWDQIMDALAAGHDAAVQMIDTSVVRVHQHGACIADNNHQDMSRSQAA